MTQKEIENVSMEKVFVTPEMAKEWLEANTKNRKLNKSQTIRMCNMMKKGQWMMNGDTICFDWNGVLIDGQHRLQSIMEYGEGVWCIVVRNLDPEAIKTKDIGVKPRNLKDLFYMDGIPDSTTVSAIVSTTATLMQGHCFVGGGNSGRVTGGASYMRDSSVQDRYNYYYEHTEAFNDACAFARKMYARKHSYMNKCSVGALFFYLTTVKEHTVEEVTDFFTQLYFGKGDNPAIDNLRTKLDKDQDKGNVMLASYKQALIVKAWNIFITGSKLKTVNYNVDKEPKPILM